MTRNAAPSAAEKITPRDYFRKEKIVLKAAGISFSGNESIAYRIYSFTFVLLFNCVYTLLDIREVFVTSVDVADMLMYVLVPTEVTLKALVFLRNRIKLGKMLNKLEQEPFLPDFERGGDLEQKLVEDCLWITNAQTLAYWVIMSITVVANILVTLLKRIRSNNYLDWELPYGPYTILNTTYSPNFEITWLYQNFSVAWIAVHFSTIDILTAGILAHISFQFKILQNNFKQIVENSYRDMIKQFFQEINKYSSSSANKDPTCSREFDTSTISWKHLHKSLKKAVEYHLAIIEMANEMEEVLSTLLLIVFLSTLTTLALLVYHASQLSFNDSRIVGTIGETIVTWIQVAITCYWGNEVMFESQKLREAVFQANFVGTDVRFQQALALIIRRSHNPTKLTAGKFTDIYLSTFVWVMRASYSSFMLLRNTNANNI